MIKERKEYTKQIHVEKLLELLNTRNPCKRCVAPLRHYPEFSSLDKCSVCRKFVGLSSKFWYNKPTPICPCLILGQAEAIKRTHLALEEGGYYE